jgi:hypothetical protein
MPDPTLSSCQLIERLNDITEHAQNACAKTENLDFAQVFLLLRDLAATARELAADNAALRGTVVSLESVVRHLDKRIEALEAAEHARQAV